MWLLSSVGRASHGIRDIRESHLFESRCIPDFFRLLLSNCLNWKINCDDHSSLGSTTAVQIYELLHVYLTSQEPRLGPRSQGKKNKPLVEQEPLCVVNKAGRKHS